MPNGYVSAPGTPTLGQGVGTWVTSTVMGSSLGFQTRTLVQLYNQETILYSNSAIQIGAAVKCIKE